MYGDANEGFMQRMLDQQRQQQIAQMGQQQQTPPSTAQDKMGQYSWTLAHPTPFNAQTPNPVNPQPIPQTMQPDQQVPQAGGGLLGRLIQSLNPNAQTMQPVNPPAARMYPSQESSFSPPSSTPPAANPASTSAQPAAPQQQGMFGNLAGGEFRQRLGDMMAGWGMGTTPQESIAMGNKTLWAGRQTRAEQARSDKIREAHIQSAIAAGVPENVARVQTDEELGKVTSTYWIRELDSQKAIESNNKTKQACIAIGGTPAICASDNIDIVKDEITARREAEKEARQAAIEQQKLIPTPEGTSIYKPGVGEIYKNQGKPEKANLLEMAPPSNFVGPQPPQRLFDLSKEGERTTADRYRTMGWTEVPKHGSTQDTTNIREYEIAKSQGFKGTLQDWIMTTKKPLVTVGDNHVKLSADWMLNDPEDPTKGARPVPGSPAEQIPAEAAARVGLAQSFFGQYPDTIKSVKAGDVSGANWIPARLGYGASGETFRHIKTGTDALRRMLTGAGMNKSEVDEYVGRYEPSFWNQSTDVTSKVEQLNRDLSFSVDAVMRGRGKDWGNGEIVSEFSKRLEPTAGSNASPPMPKPGDVMDGHRFKGGDPSVEKNWEPVQ